jgi:tripartite-type tricarboxylate transporter receptor subunit TctC
VTLTKKEEIMKTRILSFIFPLALAIGIISFSPATTAAVYPEKPVTFICGFPAGGAMDMTARAITEAAKKYFPKPMAVVNRPGAAGTIGAAEIIQAKPDGYTIGISAVAVLTVQPHRTHLPYSSPEGYTPIIKLNNLPICFAVKNDAPWKTMKEVLDYAKANPGKIRVGHPGNGTILHLDLEMLKLKANVDMTAVPFAGGGESVPALLGGHIEAINCHHGEIVTQVKAGKARVLAVYEEKRNPLFPDAPTFRELGYDVTMGVYYLILGPKGLAPATVTMLHDTFKKAMAEDVFVNAMKARGFDIAYEGTEEIKKRLMKDYQDNAKLVDILKLKK